MATNRKEPRGTREANNRSQDRGNNRSSNSNRGSNMGQSRTGSEWREMDRQQNAGRGSERSAETRHAGGGRNMEEESQDMSRFYPESSRGGRESGERGGRGRSQGNRGSGRYPIDDLTYNVITILHEKSKGLEAFDRYLQDARGDEVEDLLHEIREQDERAIEELQDHLSRLLNEGGRGRRAA